MRGVLLIRVFCLFAVTCLISGCVINFSNSYLESESSSFDETLEMSIEEADAEERTIGFEKNSDQYDSNDISVGLTSSVMNYQLPEAELGQYGEEDELIHAFEGMRM